MLGPTALALVIRAQPSDRRYLVSLQAVAQETSKFEKAFAIVGCLLPPLCYTRSASMHGRPLVPEDLSERPLFVQTLSPFVFKAVIRCGEKLRISE